MALDDVRALVETIIRISTHDEIDVVEDEHDDRELARRSMEAQVEPARLFKQGVQALIEDLRGAANRVGTIDRVHLPAPHDDVVDWIETIASALERNREPTDEPMRRVAKALFDAADGEFLAPFDGLQLSAQQFAETSLRVYAGEELRLALDLAAAIRNFVVGVRPMQDAEEEGAAIGDPHADQKPNTEGAHGAVPEHEHGTGAADGSGASDHGRA